MEEEREHLSICGWDTVQHGCHGGKSLFSEGRLSRCCLEFIQLQDQDLVDLLPFLYPQMPTYDLHG